MLILMIKKKKEYNIDFNVYDSIDHYYGLTHSFVDNDVYEYCNGMIYYVLSFDKDKLYSIWNIKLRG